MTPRLSPAAEYRKSPGPACLLAGYFWLGIGGILAITYTSVIPMLHGHAWMLPAMGPGFAYDAVLHTIFLGFVFGMIFGHAPIIFPAILGVKIRFSRRFYLHLLLLEGSVAWRVLCDISGGWSMREWAGLINGIAILLFLVNTMVSVRRKNTSTNAEPVGDTV